MKALNISVKVLKNIKINLKL